MTMAAKYQEATLMGEPIQERGKVFEGLAVRVFPDGSCVDIENEIEGDIHPDAWAFLEDTIGAEENPGEMNALEVYLDDHEVQS